MKKFLISLLTVFTVLITLIVISLLFLFLKYKGWEREFESNIKEEYLLNSENIKDINIEEKINRFALSFSDTEFLELTTKEIGSILYSVLESYLNTEQIALENIYIIPKSSIWDIYLKINYSDILFWVSFDIRKDSIQTPQIYTSSVKIGPFEINRYIEIVDMINRGISESLVTLNENGFIGRYLENIELLDDRVVLKGSRY